ncbi:MAG: P1 family peptidase [Xanthobacteraceae bacterium]|nr:P1 family peptidase [Xanthobacteraceae bacterium]
MKNLVTDVPGILVGHADDAKAATGTTAIIFEEPAVASADIRGGGPGTRELDLLDPVATVERIDAIALSGGSAFGLDAGAGVQAWLAEQGRGFAVGPARIPIVPCAILFDMFSGGDKNWGRFPPYRELGYAAAQNAAKNFALGSVGAGYGASTQNLKGGIGSASARSESGHIVGAIAAANAAGRVTLGGDGHFFAAAFEQDNEFGGRGFPKAQAKVELALKGDLRQNTTIALVATDAVLTKAQAKRLAVMAGAGLAIAIHPVYTPLDGDAVFTAATGKKKLDDPVRDLARLGALAAQCLARAVARGVYEAASLPFPGAQPSWKDKYGR